MDDEFGRWADLKLPVQENFWPGGADMQA